MVMTTVIETTGVGIAEIGTVDIQTHIDTMIAVPIYIVDILLMRVIVMGSGIREGNPSSSH